MTLRMAVGTAIPLPEVEGPLIHLTEAQKKCPHENFHATVEVNRLSDSGRFSADVRINCSECDLPFVFLGLEPGLDLDGARVSMDGLQARLAIAPRGIAPTPLDGIRGFDLKIT